MIKVAITGNIASGKSTVEKFLIEKGYKTVDTDEICHNLLFKKEIMQKIVDEFGEAILSRGKICRKKLGKIVFENENAKKKLESILHPLVKIEIEEFFKQNEEQEVVFVLIPLLYEASFAYLFDKVILVYADDEIRLNRILKRDNLTKEEALKRLHSQISQDEKLHLADCVIYNNEELDSLEVIIKIIREYLGR